MGAQRAAQPVTPDPDRAAPVARPLKVLVPLITSDLEQGREAAERAALPYYRAAGEKLLEAKAQISHGKFTEWIKASFAISERHARRYMALAEHQQHNGPASPFSSLSDFIRQTSDPHYNRPSTPPPPPPPVMPREDTSARNNRKAIQALGLQLIDAGYKALAKTKHPDVGGTAEAMHHLHYVRDALRDFVKTLPGMR